MLSDKELKNKYRKEFWKKSDRYYATDILKDIGFKRNTCIICKIPFWSVKERKTCANPICSNEGFSFIDNSPAKKLSYLDIWLEFSKLFKKLGYTKINRYPIVSRWNPTTEYVNASIACFQPYVVSGEVEPPANPLVIPQFCFRTTDIDNVGISGAHMTVFNMIGQHMFMPKEKWDQNKAFNDIYAWLKKGLCLKDNDLIFHEDAWAGGGNLGPCMEFFSYGCELGNQVYMLYEQTNSGIKELKLKVLDMGMGMERNAWFSQGSNTIYDATMPSVIKKLLSVTGLKYNKNAIRSYVPYAGLLNIDEIEDVNKEWKKIAKLTKIDVETLKENVMPLAALYSIAEHSRALLVTLSDGALPSNVGAGYNLRVLFRRAQSFIDKYNWNLNIHDICKSHSKELKKIFPELSENLDDVEKILNVEKEKYENTKHKTRKLVLSFVKEKIDNKILLKLYDTYGITPELIRDEAKGFGKNIEIPENFYAQVSELHEKKEKENYRKGETKLDLGNIPDTKILYYEDYKKNKFKAKIVKVIDNKVILDKTYFYPTSGGQMHDTGTIANENVVGVFKQGNIVLHALKGKHKFPVGEEVVCEIDMDRRIQLTQNHDAAHILLAASRKILGNHVNQAGAFKDVDKAHLDITHYKGLSQNEITEIEKEANKIISDKLPIYKRFILRNEAEKSYGFGIYQGPVVPGKMLRIVSIGNVDTEACGGTHSNNTFEVGLIKILKAVKISDSIVRLEYIAGNKASEEIDKEEKILKEIAEILNVDKKQVPARVKELFELWKNVVKKKRDLEIKLISDEEEDLSDKDLLQKTASILKTQIEHVPKTINRFLEDLEKIKR